MVLKTIGLSAVIYILLLTVLVRVSQDDEKKKRHYVPVKMLCSGAFLLFMVLSFFLFPMNGKGRIILLIAFVFCFLGDLFMGLYNIKRKKRFMIAGVIAFLYAHVSFLVFLFHADMRLTVLNILIPAAAIVALVMLSKKYHLHFGRLLVPACVYSFFVTSFMVKSIECVKITMLWPVAGILFFLSDFSLIFLYFFYFKEKKHEKLVHAFNLLTYYVSIFLIYSVAILFT